MSTTYHWKDVPKKSDSSDDESLHTHSQSERNNSSSQLYFDEISITAPKNFDDILKQSLAPIIEKLNAIEYSVKSTNRRLEIIDKELETVKCELKNSNVTNERELKHYAKLFENSNHDLLKTKDDFQNSKSELAIQLEKQVKECVEISNKTILAQISEKLSAVESSVDLHNRKLANTDNRLEKLNAYLDISNKTVSEEALKTKTDLQNTKKELALQLEKQVKESVEISNINFDDILNQSLAPLIAKLSTIESSVEGTNSRFENNDKELETVERKLENTNETVRELKHYSGLFENTKNEILKTKTDFQNTSELTLQLAKKFENIQIEFRQSLEPINEKLCAVESSVALNNRKISDTEKMFEKINVEIEISNKISSEVALKTKNELKNNKEDLQMTMSELQDTKIYLENEIFKSTPPGTIAYFTNTIAPQGWLKANGQQVSRTTYANLFASIGTIFGSGDGSTTFTLPDLRGEFIRGWSDGRDVDCERSFASFQWGSSIPYVTFIDNKWQVSSTTTSYEHRAFAGITFDGGYQTDITVNQTRNGMTFDGWNKRIVSYYNNATSFGNITGWSVLQGTRPRNIALLACIKY